jgi:hypothetical protein
VERSVAMVVQSSPVGACVVDVAVVGVSVAEVSVAGAWEVDVSLAEVSPVTPPSVPPQPTIVRMMIATAATPTQNLYMPFSSRVCSTPTYYMLDLDHPTNWASSLNPR